MHPGQHSAFRLRFPLLAGLCCAALAQPAAAQDSSTRRATAQALFEQARQLVADGQAAKACPKFEESQQLDPGVGTQFNQADCYEKVGRLASAYALYVEVAAATRQSGQAQREEVARERAQRLKPRLSKVTVTIVPEANIAGLVVARDGVKMGPAQWDVPMPVDPGEHQFTASAPGMKKWAGSLLVAGDASRHSVTIPAFTALPKEPATDDPGAAQDAEQGDDTDWNLYPNRRPRFFDSGWNIAGVSTAGLGFIGLGIGSYFGLEAISLKGKAESLGCDSQQVCPTDAGVDKSQAAQGAGDNATLALIGGGIVLAAAGAFLSVPLFEGSHEVALVPIAGPDLAVVNVRATW